MAGVAPVPWAGSPVRSRWAVQFVTGFEIALIADVAQAAFRGELPFLALLPAGWAFSSLVWALVVLLALYLVGLVADLLYSALVQLQFHGEGAPLREWYDRTTGRPAAGWRRARGWMWRSSAAREEFAGVRFIIAVCRNSAFNFGLLTMVSAVGLVFTLSQVVAGGSPAPHLWWFFAGEAAGVIGMGGFFYFSLEATRAYHALVREAASLGSMPAQPPVPPLFRG